MRIAFVLPGIPGSPTGGSKVVYEYANSLINKGHDVSIIYLHEKKKLFLQNVAYRLLLGVKALYIEPKWFSLNKGISKYVVFDSKGINADKYDIIIATAIQTFFMVSELRNKFESVPICYFIQGYENWSYSDEQVHDTYKNDVPKIVVAKWLEELVKKDSTGPVYLISNSIDNTVFYNKGLPRRKHSLVFHYRSAPIKGCGCAIRVVNRLKKKYEDLSVSVISTEEKPVDFPDWVLYYYQIKPEEVAEINNRAQVFLCTSIEEGFGLPGLEAMACGCALVSTRYQGVMEYAIDGENALLAPVDDDNRIFEQVCKIFDNVELREQIVERGKITGENRSLKKATDSFEHVLLEISKTR